MIGNILDTSNDKLTLEDIKHGKLFSILFTQRRQKILFKSGVVDVGDKVGRGVALPVFVKSTWLIRKQTHGVVAPVELLNEVTVVVLTSLVRRHASDEGSSQVIRQWDLKSMEHHPDRR